MSHLFLSIFLSTFVLEDIALAGSLALVSQGKMTLGSAFLACFLGIALGDLALYSLGNCIFSFQGSVSFLRNSWLQNKIKKLKTDDTSKMKAVIFVSRFIPGTRLPVYLGAGYLKYSFGSFVVLTLASVLAWVGLAFLGGITLIQLFQKHWVLLLISLFLVFSFFKHIVPLFFDSWKRKAFLTGWLRWTSFEFWPAWFFYPPVIGYYLYLSIKHRSLFLPMDANPRILHGGFIGESKWDFYQHFVNDTRALKTTFVQKSIARGLEIKSFLEENEIHFPFILKPDVGQRGFAVRIIKSANDLKSYLEKADFDLILQQYCDWQNEAGIFYYRIPGENKGHIFSITDKKFPFLVGDGVTRLGDLILKDKRARIMAGTYMERHKGLLDRVPAAYEIVPISECGNHCQGAIFLNGEALNTEKLLDSIEDVAKQMPDFFIGRFDIRYESKQLLKEGLNFKIVEVNGSGSEATHIWDPNTKLLDAYKVLFQQWRILFNIGQAVRDQGLKQRPVQKWMLVKEIFNLTRKDESLTLSS